MVEHNYDLEWAEMMACGITLLHVADGVPDFDDFVDLKSEDFSTPMARNIWTAMPHPNRSENKE